ncbi:MAG: alpha/beta fold hydrolase [Myxococcota bacterium]
MSQDLDFPARDGLRLRGTLFSPRGSPKARIVIGSAMGVARGYYAPFAAALAEAGALVLSFDYRGIGDSEAPDSSSLTDWGDRDLAGAFDALAARAPDAPERYLGHSVGGQLLGFVENLRADRAVFVASQSGYYANWEGLGVAVMLGVWSIGIPLSLAISGRLPMKRFGQGEDVPAGVAAQWARWGRRPGYLWSDAMARGGASFLAWRGQLETIAITDDRYAPPRSIRALTEMYRSAYIKLVEIAPSDIGASAIGHFGFFRRRHASTLWPRAIQSLLG